MNELTITIIEGENRIDSRLVAQSLEIEHRVIKQNIRRFMSDFEDIGKVTLREAPLESGQKETYYMLNEEQSLFLVTLSNNSPKVVETKRALVKAFIEARKQVAQPLTMLELAKAYVAQSEQLALAQPKADKWERYLDTDGYMSSNELAKLIGWGRNKLLRQLRAEGILTKDNLASQSYIGRYPNFFKIVINEGGYSATRYSAKFVDWYTDRNSLVIVA